MSPASRPLPGVLPVESAQGLAWVRAAVATFRDVVLSPVASFQSCREPVNHGIVVRYLASLRLPLWLVLLAALAGSRLGSDPLPQPILPIHGIIEPPLASVLSLWLLLMVPLGIPVLYFATGLAAHLGVALTGGAPRSIGATMRAVGYSLGPALLVVGALDLPLHLGLLPAIPYLAGVSVLTTWFLWQAGIALSRTHQIATVRGFVVSLLPAAILVLVTLARALLVLGDVPFLEPPSSSPYYIP